ncbi:hypothetical protein LJB42_004552 [Komagataella kurtzmanii]|nr:hypothetical protein LJB42_004552 [Komagataella kurtzmanii]
MSTPWVEKYRPKKLDEVSAQSNVIRVLSNQLKSANMPHLLFYGPPGTGKTSTILAMARELFGPQLMKSRVLELNASDERGISIVRDKVKNFARLSVTNPTPEDKENYPCPPYKLIILDEADSMTFDAQSALRRIMENYSHITRFCVICNYITRIIDPITSRCSKFRFSPLNSANSLATLKMISQSEELDIDDDSLTQILDISNGDLRKSINFLQTGHKLFGEDSIENIAGLIPQNLVQSLIETLQSKNLNKIYEFLYMLVLKSYNSATILTSLHSCLLLKNIYLNSEQKIEVSRILYETDAKLSSGSDEFIQMLNLFLQLSKIF